jgi:transposase-like protein
MAWVDMWTRTALDADSKLIVTWHLGKRNAGDADLFIRDLANRVSSDRVQISTDGYNKYVLPIQRYFENRADHGTEMKDYGMLDDESPERKYSPMGRQKGDSHANIWRS